MDDAHRQVTDVHGVRYRLARLLGRGGQGAVYEVEGGKLAAKLISDRSPSRRERLRNQLTQVKRMQLQDLALARPIEMLRKPQLGYIMALMTGMQPLARLAYPGRDQSLLAAWYLAGGGLRRRLRLLARTADVLAQLHGRGLVYGDPSPHNVFVSSDSDAHEVCLIDADNIHYQSSAAQPGVYTPGYGAPEIVAGRSGVNTLTDAYAFAVIAFQTLAVAHPLQGDLVIDGEPELEERALAGHLPWIDHPDDDENRCSSGIPRALVLSPRLRELCQQTFGPGLRTPAQRPGIASWSQWLHAAGDATLRCPRCTSTYYLTARTCPWCGAPRPRFVTVVFHLWDPALGAGGGIVDKPGPAGKRPALAAAAALAEGDPLVITERLASGRDGIAGERELVAIGLEHDRVVLTSLDGARYRLAAPAGSETRWVTEVPASIPIAHRRTSWRLHLGPPDALHRVVSFELRPEGAP